MSLPPVPLDQLDVISAREYGEHGTPHAARTRLRCESPVRWIEPTGYKGFWPVTRHADGIEVSTQPEVFQSAGRFILLCGSYLHQQRRERAPVLPPAERQHGGERPKRQGECLDLPRHRDMLFTH